MMRSHSKRPVSAVVKRSFALSNDAHDTRHRHSPMLSAQNKNASYAGKMCKRSSSVYVMPKADGAPDEEAMLAQQLRHVLSQQAAVEEKHKNETIEYRHMLRQYYIENATLRNIISAAEKHNREGTVSSSVTNAELEHLQLRVNLAVRKINRLTFDIRAEEKKINTCLEAQCTASASLKNKCNNSGSELMMGEPLKKRITSAEPVAVTGPLLLRIQAAERRLDAILSQQRVVKSISHSYQIYFDEMRKETEHHEARLQRLDQDYSLRHRDYAQLIHFYQNAQASYCETTNAVKRFTRRIEQLRAVKENSLSEKTALVNKCLRRTQIMDHRLTDLEQRLDDEEQLLAEAESQRKELSIQQPTASHEGNSLLARRSTFDVAACTTEEGEQLSAYAQAFARVMASAHVNRLDDILSVYEAESTSYAQLLEEVETKRAEVARKEEEVRQLRAHEAVHQYCNSNTSASPSSAAAHPSRALFNELRVFIEEAEIEWRQKTEANATQEAQLAELIHRLNLLAGKVAAYRPDVPIPILDSRQPDRAMIPTCVAVLAQKLIALADDVMRQRRRPTAAATRMAQIVVPANNTRIHIPKKHHGAATDALVTTSATGFSSSAMKGNAATPTLATSGTRRAQHIAPMSSTLAASLLEQKRLNAPAVLVDDDDFAEHPTTKSLDPQESSLPLSLCTAEVCGNAGTVNKEDSTADTDAGGDDDDNSTNFSSSGKLKTYKRLHEMSVQKTVGAVTDPLDLEDPLQREEVKQMSLALQRLEEKRRKKMLKQGGKRADAY